MEEFLAISAARPCMDKLPQWVATGHGQRIPVPPCGSFFALVTRLIANGSPDSKSAGCRGALQTEKHKMVVREVWDEVAVDEWASMLTNDQHASVRRVFSIIVEMHAERPVL